MSNLAKKSLRAHYKAARLALALCYRLEAANALGARLSAWQGLRQARAVLAYAGVEAQGELTTDAVLTMLHETGKLCALPRVVSSGLMRLHWVKPETRLVAQKYGIAEPPETAPIANLQDIDVVFVPGVAFTKNGARLGTGGGFYDRLLALPNHAIKVGLCFDAQLAERIQAEPHDIAMDFIFTESQFIDCRT